MIQNQYYYLVTGLPELIFDAENRKLDLASIKSELLANVEGEDINLLNALFLHYDNRNILSYINKKGGYSDLGTFTPAIFDELSEQMELLPAYIRDFMNSMSVESESNAEEEATHSQEVKLLTIYYDYVDKLNNDFLKSWFVFDRQLKNILAAVTARKLEKDISHFLVGKDEITESLTKSLSPDFGLRGDLPYMDKLMQAVETDNIIEREKKLDLLRWDFVEDSTVFSYFNIDKILAFWIKAEITDRWIKLDPATGKELLGKFFTELKGDFNISASFEEQTEK